MKNRKTLEKEFHNGLRLVDRDINVMHTRWSLEVEKTIKSFGKAYQQTVPPFSAVKRKGRPLYKLARRGEKIKSLPSRRVMIKKARLISFSLGKRGSLKSLPRARIELEVSKGFYVRSFAHDLGKKLGVGGLVVYLRRTRIGSYSI